MVGLDLLVGNLAGVVDPAMPDLTFLFRGRLRGRFGAAAAAVGSLVVDGLGGSGFGIRLGRCSARAVALSSMKRVWKKYNQT